MAARSEEFSNWGVIGHEWAVRGLARSLANDRVAHAYLFTGPHGIGKTILARALAQALECTGPQPPCGECRSCKLIARERHPDVQVIEGVPPRYDFDKDRPPPPRSNDRERRTLRIRQIRDLEREIARAPFEGAWKIVILKRFEEAEEEAENAFLKTLEEPPPRARLLITARDASLVLPTIASRCQVLSLHPLPLETVERSLIERWQIDPAQARLLARLSGGRLGWAVRASGDPKMLEARRAYLDTLDETLCEGRAERLVRAESIAKDAERLPELLEYWLGWWRDLLLVQSGDGDRITNIDRADRLREQAARLSLEQIENALKAVRNTSRYMSQNVNSRLATEVLLLNLPQLVL
jgi:DNA polymerase-3 subunit delta'